MWSLTEVIFPTHAVPPSGQLPAGSERLELNTPDGNTLRGIHIPPDPEGRESRTLILGFGGNAWNAEDAASYLHEFFPEAHVVGFHYRGYRPSTGSPSAQALIADAPVVHDFALALVKPERTLAIGFSIGSGVAASLSANRDLAGIVLVTPFDSLKAVAASLYPWLPVTPFFEHEIDAAGLLKGSEVPVAIIAGEHDEIVFPKRTNALRRQVTNLVFDKTIAAAGHNDIYARSDFQAALRDALAAVGRNDSSGRSA